MLDNSILPVDIENEMRTAYIDYAMSVIVSRALPDVRDGLKPVHRRVLYSMDELGLAANKPYKKSARIVGECFVAGTLVSTPNGLVPIETLQIGDEVYTQNNIRKVTQIYEMPKQPLLEVKTKNGRKNICTSGQMFKVFQSDLKFVWKKAIDLKVGDFLVTRSVGSKNMTSIHSNTLSINENIAYFMGIFLADGWIDRDEKRGYNRIAVACKEQKIIEKLQEIYKKELGIIENYTQNAQGLYCIKINKSSINNKIISTFGWHNKYAYNISIPSSILKSNIKIQSAFVAGFVDGDGSVHKNRNILNITSISQVFVEQMQVMLHSWGVNANLYKTLKKDGVINNTILNRNHDIYALEIESLSFQKVSSLLNLQSTQKKERLLNQNHSFSPEQFQKIPYIGEKIIQEFSEKHLGGGWYIDQEGNKIRSGIRYSNGNKIRYSKDLSQNFDVYYSNIDELGIAQKLKKLGSEKYQLLQQFKEQNLFFEQIKSISNTIEDKTYDIQVEIDHEFIANGMLVHNCLGKFHPHGDTSVYDAMVRMAQEWSMRYLLVDGQGNFGSVDGDSPAAMRYTEARLQKLAEELLTDINKETIDFQPNFDDSLQEPSVLPCKYPNLLINGTSGIAVGMATNMPPHHLGEVIDGIMAFLDNEEITIDELMMHIPGPDFPTGAIIMGVQGIRQAYQTGRGRVVMRGKADIQTTKTGKTQIVITEIPYMINKATLVERCAELIHEKKIEGVSEIRDESDREGMRIVFDLKKDGVAMVILNQLYNYTALQSSFSINNVALVKGRPYTLNLKELIFYFVEHRHEVIYRRTQFELKQAKERQHILAGYLIALDHLDEVIKLIRASKDADTAKQGLMANFELSDIQSKAILEMRLQRLTALERDKIIKEYEEITALIARLEAILADKNLRTDIIRTELAEIKLKYADKRRTEIIKEALEDVTDEDMIKDEQVVVTFSHEGYAKRTSVNEYRSQGRGGVGSRGVSTKGDDFTEHLLIASTLDYLLIFTDSGQVFWLKTYKIPEGNKTSKGRSVQNLISVGKDDPIRAILNVRNLKDLDFINNHYVMMCTQKGYIKKTSLEQFSRPRQNGIRAILFQENDTDHLLNVELTNGNCEVIIASRSGRAIRFNEANIRSMGRTAHGVRGIDLYNEEGNFDNYVVGMVCISNPQEQSLLVVSDKGYGKRSDLEDYRITKRGGKGVKTLQITEKTGKLVAIQAVTDIHDLMIINKSGLTIRLSLEQVRVMGRATQGVRLIKMQETDEIASISKLERLEVEEEILLETEEGQIDETTENVEGITNAETIETPKNTENKDDSTEK